MNRFITSVRCLALVIFISLAGFVVGASRESPSAARDSAPSKDLHAEQMIKLRQKDVARARAESYDFPSVSRRFRTMRACFASSVFRSSSRSAASFLIAADLARFTTSTVGSSLSGHSH